MSLPGEVASGTDGGREHHVKVDGRREVIAGRGRLDVEALDNLGQLLFAVSVGEAGNLLALGANLGRRLWLFGLFAEDVWEEKEGSVR
jgi:hypothetical protein